MALVDRQKELASYLISGYPGQGLPGLLLVSACAAVGNATQENQCNPVTEGAKDHGSDGLFQWRLDRLTNMQQWCDPLFGDWKTIRAQAAFFLYEVKTLYPSLWTDLVEAKKSLETLTANICAQYERPDPAQANLDNRIKAARDTFAAMGNVIPITPRVSFPPAPPAPPLRPVPAAPAAPPAPTASTLQDAIAMLKQKKAEYDAAKAEVQRLHDVLQDSLKQAQDALS